MKIKVISISTKMLHVLLLTITLVSIVLFGGWLHHIKMELQYESYISGWLLVILFILLWIYGIRKKLAVIPLISVYYWRLFHVYLAIITITVLLHHSHSGSNTSMINLLLYTLLLCLIGSGLLSLYLNSMIPGRLSRFQSLVLSEHVNRQRQKLHQQIETIIIDAVKINHSKTINQFYQQWIQSYMSRPLNARYHLINHQLPYQTIDDHFARIKPYINHNEQKTLEQIMPLVRAKTDLDFQYYNQLLLKICALLHHYFSLVILPFIVLHIILVYAYMGGLF